MATSRCGILTLSNELLREILDQIEADPEKLINLDRRAYLSQESFKPPPKPAPKSAQDLGNFRLTCKIFSDLGAIHQFARVTTRFSQKGFERLEKIAGQAHLAKHVKKFSYMVPYFYVEGRDRVNEVLPAFGDSLGVLDVSHFDRKIHEQRQIVKTEKDVRALKLAIGAFTSLQHVQILPVQDQQDSQLLAYLRHNQARAQLVDLRWVPACSHSMKTIVAALVSSRSPCSRFSSPMLSPQSAIILADQTPKTFQHDGFGALAERLTCLELHFDDGYELETKMRELSSLFKTVFSSAKNMQAVHVGFPSHRPLTLKLEDIFHNVKWEKLVAFGIQAWKLDADEIIALATRHKDRLKGLRLRDVLLKDGSRWKDILQFLRDDMTRLDWVSLRRIGYAQHFDEQWAVAGAEVPDDPPGGISSDSDDESDYSDWNPENGDSHSDHASWDTASEVQESDDDEHGPAAHEMDFPLLSPGTPSSVPWCNCNGRTDFPDSAEELMDSGREVSNAQRKLWEKWVVRRCPEHSLK